MSSPIDLTRVTGKIELTFNQLLDIGSVDTAGVTVLTNDGEVTLADTGATGGLSGTGEAFAPVTVDLSAFAGELIQIRFDFVAPTTDPRVETITANVTAGQEYFVQLLGFEDSVSPDYELNVSLPGDLPDRHEPNESIATATALGTIDLHQERELSIHSAADEDLFVFQSAGTGVLSAAIEFSDAAGDLDLYLLNAGGRDYR